jgi:diguanylate cyclase (GGDEF)-like protein
MRARGKNQSFDFERFGVPAKEATTRVRKALLAMEAEIDTLKARVAELEGLADRDPLIPVLNRRAFLDALQRSTSYVQRYGGEAAVLYIDMDAFKSINDNFGHPTGDAALRHVGDILLTHVRDSDFVGRLGGDEFAVILTNSNLNDAMAKAASLEKIIAETPFTHETLEHYLSASIGVHLVAQTEDAEAALARADEAMFANKKSVRKATAS